jgi:hypothetical protein
MAGVKEVPEDDDMKPQSNKQKGVPDIHASQLITKRITELGDWRGETLAKVRKLIREADPKITEESKWKKPSNPLGTPTWSHDGIICTGESGYGASLIRRNKHSKFGDEELIAKKFRKKPY